MSIIEQKQAAYEHLLKLGAPDIVAASMADQARFPEFISMYGSLLLAMMDFAAWNHTREGGEFWDIIYLELR
jgi:hypothetical protein